LPNSPSPVLVFRCDEVKPGHRVDPAQMVVNLLHAGDGLCADDGGLSRSVVGDDAAQINDAVADDDAEATGTPIVLAERIDDAAANVIVIGCRVRNNLTGKACDHLQQIGACYDSDDSAVLDHWRSLELVLFHQRYDRLERGIFGDGYRFVRHDLRDLADVLVNKIGRRSTWAENESQETAAPALGADFAGQGAVSPRLALLPGTGNAYPRWS
jgi:hypothetical protein